jgi:hypothetical protein
MNRNPGTPTIVRLHQMSRISRSPSRIRLGYFALDGKTKHCFSENTARKFSVKNYICKYPRARKLL